VGPVVSILTRVQTPAICGANRAGGDPNPKAGGPEGTRTQKVFISFEHIVQVIKMRLEKWQHESYVLLYNKFGTKRWFKISEAQKEFAYSRTMTYKVLNELKHLGLIEDKRSEWYWKAKLYRLRVRLEEIPFMNEPVPTSKPVKPPKLVSKMGYVATRTAPVYGQDVALLHRALYDPSGGYIAVLKKGKFDDIALIVENIKGFNTEFVSRAIQTVRINWQKVISDINSFQKRYLGASIDILMQKGYKNREIEKLRDQLFEETKNDGRTFEIPGGYKEPPEFKNIGKKWRVKLDISPAECELL
jgi:hypothetical protein